MTKVKPTTFRPSPENQKRIDLASRLGLNVSQMINDVMEKEFDARLRAESGQRGSKSSTLRRFKQSVCADIGFATWPQDVLRHTAASYLMALHKDVGRVATMLGNSPDILLSHYHNPVSEAAAKVFWEFSP